MILFFSATGNSRYAASRIAEATGQKIVSIVDCVREDRYVFENEEIGIVSPTYDWGLPSIVREFLKKASFRTGYLYFAATYGTTPGASGFMANKAIRERNIDAYYSVRMVDTWTPIFDLSTPEKVRKYTGTTEADIDRIICSVRERRRNRYMTPHTPAIFTERIAQPFYDRRVRLTSHFHVEENQETWTVSPSERIGIKNPPSAAAFPLRQRADFYFGGRITDSGDPGRLAWTGRLRLRR